MKPGSCKILRCLWWRLFGTTSIIFLDDDDDDNGDGNNKNNINRLLGTYLVSDIVSAKIYLMLTENL